MNEDEHRGYREYGTCGDCGGMRYRFFSIATQSWGEMPRHLMGENCIQNLQERIAALERKTPGDEPGAGSNAGECLIVSLVRREPRGNRRNASQ